MEGQSATEAPLPIPLEPRTENEGAPASELLEALGSPRMADRMRPPGEEGPLVWVVLALSLLQVRLIQVECKLVVSVLHWV